MPRKSRPILTRLESEIMRAVWSAGPAPVRARDVLEAVNARRRKPLAYNTVQTVLSILKDKGVVRLVRDAGRAHLYRAALTREEVSRGMVDDLVDRLFAGRVQPLLQQLLDDERLEPQDLQRLREWVERRLSDSGETRP